MTVKLRYTENNKRSAARIGAIQSLYSMFINKYNLKKTIDFYKKYGNNVEFEDVKFPLNKTLFINILESIHNNEEQIIILANNNLQKRKLEKIQPVLRSIIYCGISELITNNNIDAKLIVSEYVDIAHSFLDIKEAGMVNGLLDKISKNNLQ